MNPASTPKQTTSFISRLATPSITAALAVIALFGIVATSTARAAIPESELKKAGAIPLTTELFDKMEKVLGSIKSEAAAKAELVAALKGARDNPSLTGEGWGNLISAKCPKAAEIFKASGVTPEDFGKAGFAIETIMFADGMAPPGDKDDMAKSDDKTAAANAAFYRANKTRAETIYANFGVLGIAIEN